MARTSDTQLKGGWQACLSNRIERECFLITWDHVIGKEPLRIKELEHVLIGKVEQLFRNAR